MANKNKKKTHKGIAKVCKVRPGGTIKIGKPGSRHNTGGKNIKFNRSCRKGSLLSESDYKRIKDKFRKIRIEGGRNMPRVKGGTIHRAST